MLSGTWPEAHAYDPSDYMETRLYFDVLLDNAFKVEQNVKYKSELGITG